MTPWPALRTLLLCLALMLLLSLCACRERPAGPPAEYPPHWPLPQLSAPPGATAARMSQFGEDFDACSIESPGHFKDAAGRPQEDLYGLGFACPAPWPQVRAHILACMGESYSISLDDSRERYRGLNLESRDGRFRVQLSGMRGQEDTEFRYELLVLEKLQAQAEAVGKSGSAAR
ncbi:hypothetical protein IT575_04760 [bacterium]|nr:hypothetical protein [bacterium]